MSQRSECAEFFFLFEKFFKRESIEPGETGGGGGVLEANEFFVVEPEGNFYRFFRVFFDYYFSRKL